MPQRLGVHAALQSHAQVPASCAACAATARRTAPSAPSRSSSGCARTPKSVATPAMIASGHMGASAARTAWHSCWIGAAHDHAAHVRARGGRCGGAGSLVTGFWVSSRGPRRARAAGPVCGAPSPHYSRPLATCKRSRVAALTARARPMYDGAAQRRPRRRPLSARRLTPMPKCCPHPRRPGQQFAGYCLAAQPGVYRAQPPAPLHGAPRHRVGRRTDGRAPRADVAWFWDAVVQDLELEWFAPYSAVVDLSRGIEWPRWFPGGRYNYVHDAVDKHAARLRPASRALDLGGRRRRGPHADLSPSCAAQVNQAANALKALGIGKGDRVGVFMPMMPETVDRHAGRLQDRRDLHPHLLRLRRARPSPRACSDCDAKLLITADGFYRARQAACR